MDHIHRFSKRSDRRRIAELILDAAPALRAYFSSGWAFLIPYLVAYVLYAWLRWPVNPGAVDIPPSAEFRPASLLHVYWVLHALHLVAGVIALRSWWRERQTHSALSSQLLALSSIFPWLCLAALFWIPSAYLEWPSDPWEHLRRINEWHAHDTVLQHSSWYKSSYFLPYSLTGHAMGLMQLGRLNFYYTATCLLLCWQYYRLALAVGLRERASFVFVLIQALFFGNNIFSFYRYYGLSSSIFAQIGAVAITRIVLDYFSRPRIANCRRAHGSQAPHGTRAERDGSAFLLAVLPLNELRPYYRTTIAAVGLLLVPCSLLLLFTAFNHIQGLGLAAIGVAAAITWRLIAWRRSMIGWLTLLALVLSVATVLWWPRHPLLDSNYVPAGWMTGWYGFNFFSIASPTFERSLHILGAFGVLNLIFGLWLIIRRNHAAGWLTLLPVIVLALPCTALPFADLVAANTSTGNIVIFHRMLLAVPMGLALVATLSRSIGAAAKGSLAGNPLSAVPCLWSLAPSLFILLALSLPPGSSAFNRFWHSVQATGDDLSLHHFTAAITPENFALIAQDSTLTIASPLGTKVQEAFLPSPAWYRFRTIHSPLSVVEIEQRLEWLNRLFPRDWKLLDADTHPNYYVYARNSPTDRPALLHVDFTARDTPWLKLGGKAPEYTSVNGRLTLSNPLGAASQIFSSELTPIKHGRRYQLSSMLRQTGDPTAVNYLAVAWYDRSGQFLRSNLPAPDGAGMPIGWSIGTYSYYGLANRPAAADWTTYSITFGFGEAAAIPPDAAFLRAGALLNYRSSPAVVVQLKDVILQQKPAHQHLVFALPGSRNLHSPMSQAAYLSGHWRPHQISMKQAGDAELFFRFVHLGER